MKDVRDMSEAELRSELVEENGLAVAEGRQGGHSTGGSLDVLRARVAAIRRLRTLREETPLRLVEGERSVDPRGTSELIAGLDEELSLVLKDSGPLTMMDRLIALGIRAQLAEALATEHVALEIALLRETLNGGPS